MSARNSVLLHGFLLVFLLLVMCTAVVLRPKGTWTTGLFMFEDWVFTVAGFGAIAMMVHACMSGSSYMLESHETRYLGRIVFRLNIACVILFLAGFLLKLPA